LFLENEYPPKDMTLLIQKEVAERIVAKPGEMSLLSLSVQYYGEAKIVRKVPRSAFWPEPKVESAVIKIVCNQKSQVQRDGDVFRLARIGFSSRRKTLANNLSAGLRLERKKVTDIMKSNGLAETVRAQELAVEDWVELVKSL
jgi:16S rRNA (adenine1518-N6/adenine1519-N6)-dimethyltransferase